MDITSRRFLTGILLGALGSAIFFVWASQRTRPRKRRKLAKRIILVRHGQSAGNVDPAVFDHTPDWLVPITEKGVEDAARAAEQIKRLIRDEPVIFFLSPYRRTRQMCLEIIRRLKPEQIVKTREEPRLREQEFGNFQREDVRERIVRERSSFGRFLYRNPHGESGADVYDRVTTFLDTLFREFAHDNFMDDTNVVLVTHGLTMRIFCMRWFHWPVEVFEESWNPGNGAVIALERQRNERGDCWYSIDQESAACMGLTPAQVMATGRSGSWVHLCQVPRSCAPEVLARSGTARRGSFHCPAVTAAFQEPPVGTIDTPPGMEGEGGDGGGGGRAEGPHEDD